MRSKERTPYRARWPLAALFLLLLLCWNAEVAAQGTVVLSTGTTITLDNGATLITETVTGGSVSSYIITKGTSKLTLQSVGNKVFPVGTASSYAPVTLNNTGTTDDFSIRVDGPINKPIIDMNRVVNLEWTITEATAGGSNVALTLQWNVGDQATSFDRDVNVVIGRYIGTGVPGDTNWEEKSVTVSGSNPYMATASSFTGFSAFAVGNGGVLPVELIFFEALVDGHDAILRWATLSETNNAGFEVQHHIESDFVPLAFVNGHGTTLEPQSYSYRAEGLDPGPHQFRLKQIDFDGSFAYSPEVEVHIEMPEAWVFELYPNPFNTQATLRFGVRKAQQVTVEVFDLLGRRVQTIYQGTSPAGLIQTRKMESARLPSNVYIIRIQGETFSKTQLITLIK